MTTIACVLAGGGRFPYTAEWAQKLARQAAVHAPGHPFVCLSDRAVPGVDAIVLEYGLPGWWAKMELFRPGVFDGPVLYLDLDTLLVGDVRHIAERPTKWAMISDFYVPELAESGVMAWEPGPHTERIWEQFIRNPAGNMGTYRMDGRFIRDHAPERPERLNRVFEGEIVSFKVSARARCPAEARIVCAHGKPKFDSPEAGWAHDAWRNA